MSGLIPSRGALATWVELYSPTSEAPPEAHLGAAIAVISAAIGGKAWIPWAGLTEPCTGTVNREGRRGRAKQGESAGPAPRPVSTPVAGTQRAAAFALTKFSALASVPPVPVN